MDKKGSDETGKAKRPRSRKRDVYQELVDRDKA